MKYIFHLILFSFPVISVFAQKYPLTVINFEDGLNKSEFYEVIKDNQGYMWMAADGALVRYDGREFIYYSNRDGILGSYVTDIDIDLNNHLWVSTYGGGIAVFDGKSFHSYNTKNGFPSDYLRDAIFSSVGDMWLATEGDGIIRISNGIPQIILDERGERLGDCWNVIEDTDHNIWSVSPRGGIGRFSKTNNYAFELVYKNDNYRLTSLAEDKDGWMWAAGAFCLLRFKNDSVIDYSSQLPPNSIVLDIHLARSSDKLYLATADNFIVWDYGKISVLDKSNGLINSQFWNIYEDESNDIWLSSGGGGVVKYDNYGIRIYKGQDELVFDSRIIDIVDDHSGRIIVGTELNGFFSLEDGKFSRLSLPGLEEVVTAYAAIYNKEYNLTLLSSSGGGSVFWARNGKIIKKFIPEAGRSQLIYDVEFIDSNQVMIASDAGCFITRPNETVPERIESIPIGYYRGIFKDKEGYLWILGDNGHIFKYKDQKAEDVTTIINPEMYIPFDGMCDTVNHLYWFCTNSGLVVWNENQRIVLHAQNGLNSDMPKSITQDTLGRIWIGHDKGITMIDVVNKSFKHIGYEDGFIGVTTNQRSIGFDLKGNLMVGSGNELYIIDPSSLVNKNKHTKLRLQSVSFKESIYFQENYYTDTLPDINLYHNQNNLQIDLAALDFVNAEHVTYSWRLKGYESEFRPYSKLSEANYTNLPPGDYEFIAKAIDSDGFETNQVKMKIFIAKPFWEKLWFYALEIFIFIVIVVLSFIFSGKKSDNRFGQIMTFLTIIIFFESAIFYLSNFINPLTNGIPVFQLVMNIILAAVLQPIEQLVKRIITRRKVS